MDGPNKRTPIIAVTANAMRGDREKCIASVPVCVSVCVSVFVSVCLCLCLCVCVCVVSLHLSTSVALSLSLGLLSLFDFLPSVLHCYFSRFLSVSQSPLSSLSLSLNLSVCACRIGKDTKMSQANDNRV